jgi:hypothetical protein
MDECEFTESLRERIESIDVDASVPEALIGARCTWGPGEADLLVELETGEQFRVVVTKVTE